MCSCSTGFGLSGWQTCAAMMLSRSFSSSSAGRCISRVTSFSSNVGFGFHFGSAKLAHVNTWIITLAAFTLSLSTTRVSASAKASTSAVYHEHGLFVGSVNHDLRKASRVFK